MNIFIYFRELAAVIHYDQLINDNNQDLICPFYERRNI